MTHGGFSGSVIEYLARDFIEDKTCKMEFFQMHYRIPLKPNVVYKVHFEKENKDLKYQI